MVLTGHSDAKVHQRYVEAAISRELPAAAVPYMDPNAARLVANRFEPRAVSKAPRASALFPEREKGFETGCPASLSIETGAAISFHAAHEVAQASSARPSTPSTSS
jgi:hypothetical protein